VGTAAVSGEGSAPLPHSKKYFEVRYHCDDDGSPQQWLMKNSNTTTKNMYHTYQN
jgi:hypothetical protein